MKIYRCFVGVLFVFFIALAIAFIISHVNEQGSEGKGTLIWQKNIELIECMRGEGGDVTDYSVC